jgi:hypothetical protein
LNGGFLLDTKLLKRYSERRSAGGMAAALDWPQCPAVMGIPGNADAGVDCVRKPSGYQR